MSYSGINVFLERWSNEAAPEIVDNHLQTFSYMKDLYPELGKYGDQHDLLVHFHSDPETIWIVNVNVSNDIMFVERDEVLLALHGGNSSYRTPHATGTEAEYSSFEDLRSLPSLGSAYNDPSNALDALSNVSNESSSSLGITFSTSGFGPLDSLPAFPSPLPQDPDATPKPGPSQSPNPKPTSGGLNHELEALEDFPAPSPPGSQIRALPKDDLNLSVHDWGVGERLGLGPANATFRKFVVGLVLVMPSTLCLSEHLELDGSKTEMFQESGPDLLSKQRNTRDMLESPKSCDICVLLNFSAPEVSAKLTEQSQVEITPQVREQLTQEAIFNLLLEIEPTVKSLNVQRYRVLMTEEGLREHETTFLAFLDM
ncbi:hypothetical protein AN958_11116 [Leucoagaricus sp. SymC.cos]|nr:hypothetical protein AN958_11116 [Leucoagaricus sp. SymC.cos]